MVLGHVAAPTVSGGEDLAAVAAGEGLRDSQVGAPDVILKCWNLYHLEETHGSKNTLNPSGIYKVIMFVCRLSPPPHL